MGRWIFGCCGCCCWQCNIHIFIIDVQASSPTMFGCWFSSLYTNRLFHCYMLDESICYFKGIGSILSLLFYFLWKILLANIVDPDQTPHYVASDLDLHSLPMTILRVSM